MVIFLVGFMGCGKSTIGRMVAKGLGYQFADTDKMIEQGAGRLIEEIFVQDGEEVFRQMESDVLSRFKLDENIIVATGGGAPCRQSNIDFMKSVGCIVYFEMKPERLLGRLQKGRARRPKIAGMDDTRLLAYIEETLAERGEYYRQASMILDCNGVSDEYITSHIRYYIENI